MLGLGLHQTGDQMPETSTIMGMFFEPFRAAADNGAVIEHMPA
jgi:hypothetical protein